MDSSDIAAVRRSPTPQAVEHWKAAHRQRNGTAGADSDMSGAPCYVCGKARHSTASCEQWERVEKLFAARQPGRLMWGRPRRLVACKDCCIGELDGHRCVWWRFCWQAWP